jgi:tetratricopeptide (TPR) repeat protein
MIDQKFLHLFLESIAFKDAGMLKSALSKRKEATERMKHDEAHYALGKANEAILLGYHIGDGIAAFDAAKEALKNTEVFYTASKEWEKVTGLTVFNDIFNIIRQWSASYDECVELNKLRVRWIADNGAKQNLEDIENCRKHEPHWWITQLSIAYKYYSRERPELDKGLYAQGMSVLQCILSRSFTEDDGYNLDYDTYIHLLDDYIVISIKHFQNVLNKYQIKAGLYNNPDNPEELLIILEKTIKIWTDFASILETKDKALFTDYFVDYWLSLAMIHRESLMNPIAKYLPEAMVDCPVCGRQIANGSPMCRYCGKMTGMFPKALKNQKMPEFNLKDIESNQKNTKKQQSTHSCGCVIIFVIIIAGIIAYLYYSNVLS